MDLQTSTTHGRTTIRLPDALHKRLKVLAAERDTTMQELLESALTYFMDAAGGIPGAQHAPAKTPAHLISVVEAFLDFWQHPKNPTEQQIRHLMEEVLGTHAAHASRVDKTAS
jgi:antitoxin-like ribbon-helix-helix protein